jgi:HK97 gp10 family phage protein
MSVSVNLDVSGAEEFSRAVGNFDSAMQSRVQEQLGNWAEDVQAEAQRVVPVRTGYLQSSIYANVQGWQVEVGAEASYAAAVEFGTRYAQAQPYITPAVEAYLPSLETVIAEALEQAKAEAQL